MKPAKECWQPQDFLPDASSDGFHDQLRQLQERTKEIPDEYFVVLVRNMITEEALPSYHSRINGTEIFHDKTGVDETPWAIWARGWSAEENRHGDLLNKYLYLSGRVDMKQVETTIQYLIAAGLELMVRLNADSFRFYPIPPPNPFPIRDPIAAAADKEKLNPNQNLKLINDDVLRPPLKRHLLHLDHLRIYARLGVKTKWWSMKTL
ncbi:hypothetical protein FEM48_Zijuj05G0141900 [Ziziphus jujuba var. spinosa]|uniref:Uncharacterized protein n=1 Tax=Ziziphus jujuba var. spinosa TaxID=714518 RepID=A0A978VFA5_ZIZJJ|nr:hypothetical protein FEM48_Zijuj05G0141900 [Ziziphus jujuba var. spinosa]